MSYQSKWEFRQIGNPFPFENTSLYHERLIKNRLNVETLEAYAKEFGIYLFAPSFYKNESFSISTYETLIEMLQDRFITPICMSLKHKNQ